MKAGATPAARKARPAAIPRVGSRPALRSALMAPRRCLVCGTAHAACGAETVEGVVDVLSIEETPTSMGRLKRYDTPTGTLRLSDAAARARGLNPADGKPDRIGRPAPIDEVSEAPVAEGVVVEHGTEVPKGAIPPGGPTARAREAALEEERLARLAAEEKLAEAEAALAAAREAQAFADPIVEGDGTEPPAEGVVEGVEAPADPTVVVDAPTPPPADIAGDGTSTTGGSRRRRRS